MSIYTKNQNNYEPLRLIQDTHVIDSVLEVLNSRDSEYLNIQLEHMRTTYMSGMEDSIEILTEGLSDFFKGILQFLKDILQKLKELFSRVFLYIQSFIQTFEVFIKSNMSTLKEIEPDFSIKGYEFKLSIPIKLSYIDEIVDKYNRELDSIEGKDKGFIVDLRNENASDEYFNRLRGRIIGKQSVEAGEFSSTIRNEMRGSEDPVDIKIDKSKLNEYLSEYKDIRDEVQELKKKRDESLRLIGSLITFFEKGATVHYQESSRVMSTYKLETQDNKFKQGEKRTEQHSGKKLELLNSFYNYKFLQAKQLSSITSIAIGTRIEVVKQMMKQYESTIRHAVLVSKRGDK